MSKADVEFASWVLCADSFGIDHAAVAFVGADGAVSVVASGDVPEALAGFCPYALTSSDNAVLCVVRAAWELHELLVCCGMKGGGGGGQKKN